MSYKQNLYDPNQDAKYRQALQDREALLAQKPVWQDNYGAQTQSLYEAIQNREAFTYDPEQDPLYRQYRQQQLRSGRLAMEDTLGKAASLTGGYSSSYAQTAAQQTYGEYLHRLSQALPEYYALSREGYDAQTEDLYRRYELALGQSQEDYDRYRDSMSDYLKQLDSLEKQANEAYDRGYTQWYNALKLEQEAQKQALSQSKTAYDRLTELISMGYQPTAQELAAVGMTRAQAQILGQWGDVDGMIRDAAATAAAAGAATNVGGKDDRPEEKKSYWQYLKSLFSRT